MTKPTDLVLWKNIRKEKVQVCFLGFVRVSFGDFPHRGHVPGSPGVRPPQRLQMLVLATASVGILRLCWCII